MADRYASGYQKAYVNVPSEKIPPGEASGEVKIAYAELLGTVELTTADELYLMKLPQGARVLGGKLVCPQTGAAGTFKVGYKANGIDVAVDNAFVLAAAVGAGAVAAELAGAGIGKKFAAETTVTLIPSVTTVAFTGKLLQIWVQYVTV